MKGLREKYDGQWLALLGLVLLMGGLLFSRAMMSIGIMVLTGQALLHPNLRQHLRRFFREPALWGLTGLFLVYLLSGLNSSDQVYWLDRIRMKLPFLVLPFAFLSIPRFPRRLYYQLLLGFFWLVTLLALHSLFLFLLDMERITFLYREGRVMPTPVFHIRFSLMAVISVAIGWYLHQKKVVLWHPVERPLLLGAVIFLILYIHLLAVRSGLLALYGVLAYFFIREVVFQRKFLLGFLVAAFLALSLWTAFRFIPTLRNKLGYTLYSIELFQRGENIENLSDAQRLGSIFAGWALVREHPLAGVGVGDIRDETERYLSENYPSLQGFGLLPQNQYLFIWAAAGLFGLLWFGFATTAPLLAHRAYVDPLFLSFHIIYFLSFLTDHALETQLGTALYLFFLLMGMRVGHPPNTGP